MMQQIEWFRVWFSSPYYHLLYSDRDKEEATYFVDKVTGFLQIAKPAFILDAACGKGRHSIAFAQKGFDVTGVDIAAAVIAEAKKYERDNLHFFLHDIRLPFYINYFNYAFNFFTSFGYFKTRREHNDAMRTLAQSLKPNGLLTIDYLNVLFAENNLQPKQTIEANGIVFNIERWCDEKHFFKRININDKEKNITEEYTEQVEKFSLDDFKGMLSQQGLQIENVFGDYDLNAYKEETSPRMILIARKVHV